MASQQITCCFILSILALLSTCEAASCEIREIFDGTCDVRCTFFGVNGNTEDPGVAAGTFLSSIYDTYKDQCFNKWILEITDSQFPSGVLRSNWLVGTPLPPITSLVLHTVGISLIEEGAFDAPHLGENVQILAIYNNKDLKRIDAQMTVGLTKLTSFQWVGNGEIEHADASALNPFYETLQDFTINDCGFASASVVANMTGFCQTSGFLTTLRAIDFGYNPSAGLETIGSRHFSKLRGVLSMYLWSSGIKYFENTEVFDPVAATIETLDLSNNLFTTLPEGSLNSIIAVNKPRVSIALQGNPWHCDSALAWLQNVIRYSLGNIFLSDRPVCASPASQAGKLLIEADMSEAGEAIGDKPLDVNC